MPRETLRLHDGWLFHKGDVPAPIANTHLAGYMANKAGWARGAARGNFDDSDWQPVRVPHDWSVDGPFSPENHVNSGFLPRGVGWYRRHFRLDDADRGRVLKLRFDAIASHATVYVNGHLLARSYNGYLPVDVDFSDVATYGDELNVIAVRVDATVMEGWWYEGAGIYRDVWLTKRQPTHFADDALRVITRELAEGHWKFFISGRVDTSSRSGLDVRVAVRLYDPQGGFVAQEMLDLFVPGGGGSPFVHLCRAIDPQLWDVDVQYFYRVECDLIWNHVLQETTVTRFGVRTTAFHRVPQVGGTPQTCASDAGRGTGLGIPRPVAPEAVQVRPSNAAGFFLNGRHVLLKGVCVHQDHAGVGVTVPPSIHRFRVQRLKDMGCSAVRVGHHPPAPEFLDACDELGLLVMDENRTFGSSREHLSQLRAMVRRDINHPSVILWSICNEESIQTTPAARNIAEAMIREVKRLDSTRPVTAAISGGILNDGAMSETIDVMSINYSFPTLDPFHAKWPNKPVLSSETGCTLSTRGVYETSAEKKQFASYDDDFERWGSSAREAWRQVTSRPWMAGLFVWTGFDYRGEPSPHAWPSVTSHWGLMDLCGFEKDAFWRHKAYFSDDPVLHLLPHWNGYPVGATPASPATVDDAEAGDAGVAPTQNRVVRVQALTNCHEVELWLNGRALGRKAVDPIDMAEWQVPYEPGTLRAVGYRDGVEVATAVVETTGPAVALGVEVHPSCDAPFAADGETAWPVTVFAVDSDGRRVPDANRPLTITIEGPARLLGVGNGDPNGHFANRGPDVPLFNGLAQAIAQATTTAGPVTIRAASPGLADGVLTFDTKPTTPRPSVPVAQRRWLIADWLMGPVSATPPDVSASAAGTDMNTWERVKAGGPQTWPAAGWRLYRATLKPPKAMAGRGARLVFDQMDGEAEVFIDGQHIAAGSGRLAFDMPTRTTPAELVVRMNGNAGSGINRPVEIVLSPGRFS